MTIAFSQTVGTKTTNFSVCDIFQFRIYENFPEKTKQKKLNEKLKHLVAVLEHYFRSKTHTEMREP